MSQIETYRGIPISIEESGDQNYYFVIDGAVIKSQLIDQLYSEIDKRIDEPKHPTVALYDVTYLCRGNDSTYFRQMFLDVSDDTDILRRNAMKALRQKQVPVNRVLSVILSRSDI